MLVLLVRHGHAGAKRQWHADDGFRPLDNVSVDEPGAVVLCTHGEVIHEMQAQLAHDGIVDFGPASPREKGSVWVLERADGRFCGARYVPPPLIE